MGKQSYLRRMKHLRKVRFFDSPREFHFSRGIWPRGCVSRLSSGTLAQGRAGAWKPARTRAYRRRRASKVLSYTQRPRSRVKRARVVRNGSTPRRALTLSLFTFAGKKATCSHASRAGRGSTVAARSATGSGFAWRDTTATWRIHLRVRLSRSQARDPSRRPLRVSVRPEVESAEKCSTPAAFG